MLEPKFLPLAEDAYTIQNKISLENILGLEQEILNVMGDEKLIVPDKIRQPDKSLVESVKSRGWPSVYNMRDTFMFILWNGKDIRQKYVENTNSLQGRIIFPIMYISEWDSA